MTTNHKGISEEELNRRRTVEHKLEQEDEGIVETIDRAFESVVSPFVKREGADLDEDEIKERRKANDEASRP